MEISIKENTVKAIEKAKKELAKKPGMEWVEALEIDQFLNLMFGFSEMSQYIREVWLNSIREEEEVKKEETEIPIAEKPKVYYSPSCIPIIKALLKYDIPLTRKQISMVTGMDENKVRARIEMLSRKRILKKVAGDLWTVDKDVLNQSAPKESTIKNDILKLFEKKKELTITEICKELPYNPRSVSAELSYMVREGKLKRIGTGKYTLQ